MKTLCDFYSLGNNYGNCFWVKKSSFRERVWKLQAYCGYQCSYLTSFFLSSSDCQTCDQRQNRLWLLLYCSWDVSYAHQCYTCQNIILLVHQIVTLSKGNSRTRYPPPPFSTPTHTSAQRDLRGWVDQIFFSKTGQSLCRGTLAHYLFDARTGQSVKMGCSVGLYIKLAQYARFANPNRR